MNELIHWVSFIRDIGLILGIPVLITVGIKLYSQQIEILKARNDLLRETQYDRAAALLESQKKVFLIERDAMDKQVADLKRLRLEDHAQIAEVVATLDETLKISRSISNEAMEQIKAEEERLKSERDEQVKNLRKRELALNRPVDR